MCRLFGQISNSKQGAFDFLAQSRFSLLAQSDWDKKHLQKDGWGISAWGSVQSAWRTVKSEKPVYKEKEEFKKIARSTKSKIILAHIRHASNPKKLPFKELIHIENCQPFTYKNLAFSHNGTLNIPDALVPTLGYYKKRICGTNDSEVLFWLFVKIYFSVIASRRRGNLDFKKEKSTVVWKIVFQRMIEQIESIWKKLPAKKRKFTRPFQGLNCIASDGDSVATLCFYEKAEGKSLCGQKRPYFEMCYNILPDPFTLAERIAIASEPMDESGNWKPISNRTLMVVELKNLRVAEFQLRLLTKSRISP